MTDELEPMRGPSSDDDGLFDLIEAARAEAPTEAQRGALRVAIGIGGPAGGGGGSGAGADAASAPPPAAANAAGLPASLLGKAALGTLAATVVAGAVAVALVREPRALPPPSRPAIGAPAETLAPSAVGEVVAPAARPAEAPTAEPAPSRPRPTTPTRAPAPEEPAIPERELDIVAAAHAALRTSPSDALRLADAHARRFPSGSFVEERETIAIEALAALGRIDAARTRAERLRATYPGSALLPRIERLLGSVDEAEPELEGAGDRGGLEDP